jgi:sigma-B regulation protein RsbU (phosphoserine phosphatase)
MTAGEVDMPTAQSDRAVPAERPITVLLIDDQPIMAESVRRMLASEADIHFHYCQDPTKAIETANTIAPTVILQDLVMPEIDGLMLVRFFRANKSTRDVPMIVLSSKEEPTIKAQAFAQGANDYLVKLPDKLEVVARIRYHSRGYIALLERNEAYARLAESQQLLAAEVATAARYVQSLLPEKLDGPVRIDWKFVPSTQLGGDMFGYHWLDRDHLAMYLLDVSGHGVGSSLLAVSAANVLSSRSLPETDFRDPGQVLSRLNDVFQMDRQDNKYFTIFYGVFHKSARSLAYCNAGHPDALLFTGPDAGRATLHQLASTDPIIGMLPPGMPFETRRQTLGEHARLVICSDGVFEIERPDGVMWQFPEFVAFVAGLLPGDASVIEPLLAMVHQLRGGELLADDFSLLEVRL